MGLLISGIGLVGLIILIVMFSTDYVSYEHFVAHDRLYKFLLILSLVLFWIGIAMGIFQ